MNTELVRARLAVPPSRHKEAADLCLRFLDMAATATGRATFDNKQTEVQQATATLHEALFALDRGVYAAFLALPGVMDNAKQLGIQTLLDTPHQGSALLDLAVETDLLHTLMATLPRQRQLKLAEMLRGKNVNNARTKKLILRTILNADNLDWIVIKYRRKVKAALTFCFGQRRASIIRRVLAKPRPHSHKERVILHDEIDRFLYPTTVKAPTYECIAFALGHNGEGFTLDKLAAYTRARGDYRELAKLPPEVAEGFRGRFHQQRSVADVVEKTVARMTDKQKVRSVARAEKLQVDIQFDPRRAQAVDLLVMAYERGELDQEAHVALESKARKLAQTLPWRYNRIALVIDYSASTAGSGQQKWRPVAVIEFYTRALRYLASDVRNWPVGGRLQGGLLYPCGETDLATPLLEALEREPEAVFVLTDGYENAPAGRFYEVVKAVREIGVQTPIYQLTPTFAAETFGVRKLWETVVYPISDKPQALDLATVKTLLAQDFVAGVSAALQLAQIGQLSGGQYVRGGQHAASPPKGGELTYV